MKLAIPNIPFILYLSLFILITSASPLNPDYHPEPTIDQKVDASQSAVINIDQLLKLTTPVHITQLSSSTCKIQRTPMAVTQQIPFTGSFSKSERAFMLNGIHYMLKIDPESKQVTITIYKLKLSEDNSKSILIQETRRMLTKKVTSKTDIVDLQIHGYIVLVSTDFNLLVFNFVEPANPKLVQVYQANKPIHLFTMVKDSLLFIAQESSVNAYDTSEIGLNGIKDMATIGNYMLPNSTQQRIHTIRSMCTCDNIAFVSEDKQIFIFNGTAITADSKYLAILKTLTFDAEVIHMRRVGRSLVVMTSEELIEYIFIKDCLDLKENMRVLNTHIDVDPTLSFQDRMSLLDLQGSDQGRYFALLNQLYNSIHVFQSGGTPATQNASLPFLYTYKNSSAIYSLALYDYFNDYQNNGLNIVMNHDDNQASVIVFKAETSFLVCNSSLPISDTVSIQAEARFCGNEMYNHTDLTSKITDVTFSPVDSCKRSVNVVIKYAWSTTMIIAVAVSGLAILAIIIICVRKCQKKKKKVNKYRGHKRFHNEKGDLDQSNANNRIDISSLSLPAGTDRKGDSDVEADKKNANKDANPRRKSQLKKSFSKKKNLSIKIPEN